MAKRSTGVYFSHGQGRKSYETKLIGILEKLQEKNPGLKKISKTGPDGAKYSVSTHTVTPIVRVLQPVTERVVPVATPPAVYVIRTLSSWYAYSQDFVQLDLAINGDFDIDVTVDPGASNWASAQKNVIVHQGKLYIFGYSSNLTVPAFQVLTASGLDLEEGLVSYNLAGSVEITYTGQHANAKTVHCVYNDGGTFYAVIGVLAGTGTPQPYQVIRSTDLGVSWTLLSTPITFNTGGSRACLQMVKSSSGRIATEIFPEGGHISSTDGNSWSYTEPDPRAIDLSGIVNTGPFGTIGGNFFVTGEDSGAINHGQVISYGSDLSAATNLNIAANEYGDMDFNDPHQIGYVDDRAYITGRHNSSLGRGSLGYSTNGISWTNISATSNLTNSLETGAICSGLWSANNAMIARFPTTAYLLRPGDDVLTDWTSLGIDNGMHFFVYLGVPEI